ncbi:GTP 3',8-cyclase MoaA [Desulfocurvus vexinensis]|uniref:GTP 3',8-cyclase MoaA n=1 Tax=Desulfocurvus vexinensis TaxID=399548 RepID=UPI00048FE0F0|nr:GTP 3',8-cyclase MoaA [Desulfocurvus vexinensis]
MLVDGYGREVSYLRLSVTDRCNLNCFYCRTGQEMEYIPHENILTYEEMVVLARAARALRVEKLRLTGGEPFARRDFLAFLGLLREQCPELDVRITTNATLLAGKAAAVKHLGIRRINISMDTLDPAKFLEITGRDMLDRVLAAIDECLGLGLRVKINVVAMKGVNDMELPAFVRLACDKPVDVRFIEFMPIGASTRWNDAATWTAREIIAQAGAMVRLTPLERHGRSGGPARLFAIEGGQGRLGVISPLSDHFCTSCNRLRVTSDGRLRTCLFSDKEYRLRPALRHPRLGIDHVVGIMRRALRTKPMGYELLELRRRAQVCDRVMSSIGG